MARMAAVGAVTVAGMLVAVNTHEPGAAKGTAALSPTKTAFSTKQDTATSVLATIKAPPLSTAVLTKPSNAPNNGGPPFTSDASDQQIASEWWSTNLPSAAVMAWFRAHPPTGMTLSMWGSATDRPVLGFAPSHQAPGIANEIVYVETFTLSGGATGIQLTADITYQPVRSAQDVVPTAALLVVTARFAHGTGPAQRPASVTITDPARVADVARIINGLHIVTGTFSCPADFGGGLRLRFESPAGANLAQADLEAGGCEFAGLTVGARPALNLGGGGDAIGQIQRVIGTHWILVPSPPHP